MPTTTTRRKGQRPLPDDKTKQRETFLKVFRETAIVGLSARKAGVSRATIYNWRREDPMFATAFQEAEQDANDVLREEMYRRGVEGVPEVTKITGKDGSVVRTVSVRKYDTRLLVMLAQARMPEFRDRYDVTSNGQSLAAHEAIANAAADPITTDLATQLLERIAGTSSDPSGLGLDRE